jgi:hypothetical protein
MRYDIPNVVVDNVFTEEEVVQIKGSVAASTGSAFVAPHCQLNNFIQLPQNIVDKFTQHARIISNNDNVVLTEYCHAIYKNTEKDGKKFRPSLFPHYDETFKEPRFTFDYQLDGNIEWTILVEHRPLSLSNNQAATFSGTHQIHWREPKQFADDQYVEMIFCHFTDPTMPLKDEAAKKFIDAKAKVYHDWYYANGGFSNEKTA